MSLSSRSRFPRSPLPISLLGAAVAFLVVSSTGPSLASQGDDAMLLAYKFQPGAVRLFRAHSKLHLTVGAGAAGLIPPISAADSLSYSEKCLDAKENRFTIIRTVHSATSDVTVGGSAAGKKRPQASKPGTRNDAQGGTVQVLRSPTGQETVLEAKGVKPNENLTLTLNLVLPERPLKVGDSWETETTSAVPVPTDFGQGKVIQPKVLFRLTNSFKELKRVGDRKIAVIETLGTGEFKGSPEDSLVSMNLSLTSNSQFDVDGGYVRGESGNFDFLLRLKVETLLPPQLLEKARTEGRQLPEFLDFDGTLAMTTVEGAPTPTKPAVGRKPAPVSRKR